MAVNKVVMNTKNGADVLLDLTGDSVTPDKLLKGTTAHAASGVAITGTCDYDSNTQDATATAETILQNQTAYAKGTKVTGSMINRGGVAGIIVKRDDSYTIDKGFHSGGGKVSIDPSQRELLIPENIRGGITVLGVTGTMSGTEGANPQSKRVVPSAEEQVVTPDSGYNYLSQVTVAPIPYSESANSAGGTTVTIG